jgi:hypothetical protein
VYWQEQGISKQRVAVEKRQQRVQTAVLVVTDVAVISLQPMVMGRFVQAGRTAQIQLP